LHASPHPLVSKHCDEREQPQKRRGASPDCQL
jgi:hypothetical protein